MNDYFGFSGRILVIDLSRQSSRIDPLDMETAEKFLGGFAMNSVLFHAFSTPGTTPLDPTNPIILGAGPLIGTLAPGASRVMATTKFPLTGAVAAASGSMSFGPQMKWAGYDHLVILGKAQSPVYVTILGDDLVFHDAKGLVGKGIHETTHTLRKKHDPSGGVIAIGPAGEALLPSSLALTDNGGTLGRGGLGAVMGAKNLKALYVLGTGAPSPGKGCEHRGVRVRNKKEFLEEIKALYSRARKYPLHGYCINKGMMAGWEVGITSMFQHHLWSPEQVDALYGQHFYEQIKKRRLSCPSCFIADKDFLEWEYQGEKEQSPFTSYINVALAAHVGISNPSGAAHLLKELDDAGCDIFTFGRMADALIRCQEAGTLPSAYGAEPLDRDEHTCLRLLRLAIQRKGIGELFHMGLEEFINHLGPVAAEDLIVVKGQDALYDPRNTGLGTMEFEQIVCPRGPSSASSGSPSYLPGVELDKFKQHAQRMGASALAVARIFDSPYGFNVGRLTRYSEDWYTVFSSLGVCNRAMVNRFYHIETFSRLLGSATGIRKSPEDIMRTAERAWTLLRVLNQREGFSRNDDRIPEQWFIPSRIRGEKRHITDYFRQHELTLQDVEQLVRDYYDERGWDPDTGYPTREKLRKLDIDRYL